ncbi:Lrp/AsnC ligand binding domain-containing protein [Shewanella sp. 6_MG-2023]|uniref:Lrp/AsnC ligand binding domain-containing protein n=1 Tax=unclassified Shewanella TaxID=196818 RepID=UPI0034A49C9B
MDRDRDDIYRLFRQTVMKAPEVTQCYQISGRYDFMLIVCVTDIQAYENLLIAHCVVILTFASFIHPCHYVR